MRRATGRAKACGTSATPPVKAATPAPAEMKALGARGAEALSLGNRVLPDEGYPPQGVREDAAQEREEFTPPLVALRQQVYSTIDGEICLPLAKTGQHAP